MVFGNKTYAVCPMNGNMEPVVKKLKDAHTAYVYAGGTPEVAEAVIESIESPEEPAENNDEE